MKQGYSVKYYLVQCEKSRIKSEIHHISPQNFAICVHDPLIHHLSRISLSYDDFNRSYTPVSMSYQVNYTSQYVLAIE